MSILLRKLPVVTAAPNKVNFLKLFSSDFNPIKSKKMSEKTVLAILSPGSEEMELVISVDVLRRAGIKVTVAGLQSSEAIRCSRDIVIVPDVKLEDVAENVYDCVLLPGGLGGSKAMCESQLLGNILKKQESADRLIAAICAAPTSLLAHSIGLGKSITSYPGVKEQLSEKYKYIDDQVVVQDGQLITSRGPGTAMVFGLKIAEVLAGEKKAQEVGSGMLLNKEYKLV